MKTTVRRLKTSPRLFLVKAEDHPENIHGFSVYAHFKLHTYYHPFTDKLVALV